MKRLYTEKRTAFRRLFFCIFAADFFTDYFLTNHLKTKHYEKTF